MVATYPLAEVAEAQKASGLIVHGVVGHDHWSKPLSDPSPAVRQAGRDSFIGTLHDCKAYGGTTALLVPGRVNKRGAGLLSSMIRYASASLHISAMRITICPSVVRATVYAPPSVCEPRIT